ncbi:MAG: hypothetical protein J6U77_08080, partial [Verrucomicrobia bacterium]|nr:hypothetical protein [Verrucomicrobiota bacterium]
VSIRGSFTYPSVVLFNPWFPGNTHPTVFEKLDSFLWNLYWNFLEHRNKIPRSGRPSPAEDKDIFPEEEAPAV